MICVFSRTLLANGYLENLPYYTKHVSNVNSLVFSLGFMPKVNLDLHDFW